MDQDVLDRLSQVLRAERVARAGLQPAQVFDTISRHMVTLENCVNKIGEVKKRLKDIDEDPEAKPVLKILETEVKIVRLSLDEHKEEVKSFDAELQSFEEETQRFFNSQESFLAEDYRQKVEQPTADIDRRPSVSSQKCRSCKFLYKMTVTSFARLRQRC